MTSNYTSITVYKDSCSDRVSGTTKPSSTIAMLVFEAPASITQAYEIPAPYVALMDSYIIQSEGQTAAFYHR